MTPSDSTSDGPMTQARAYVKKAMTQGQPRRYIARRLADSHGLTERQVAEALEVSQKTVNRDLASTKAPVAHTKKGTPVYPPGRFDTDQDFKDRVAELSLKMPPIVARRAAATEFAGPVVKLARKNAVLLKTPEEKAKVFESFERGIAASR